MDSEKDLNWWLNTIEMILFGPVILVGLIGIAIYILVVG